MTTIKTPICFGCKHFKGNMTCDAFPDGIPEDIRLSRHDHRDAYPGDNGVRYEPKDHTAAKYAGNMFADRKE